MTMQAAREKLLKDAAAIIREARLEHETDDERVAYDVLALVAEGLADVTEEMDRAGEAVIPPAWPRRVDLAAAVFRAMLSASALGNGGK